MILELNEYFGYYDILLYMLIQFVFTFNLYLMFKLNKQGNCTFTSQLEFKAFSFQNRKATNLGEKIDLKARMQGSFNLGDSAISAKVALSAETGEILYDRFYFDLNRNALFTSCEGSYDISNKSLQLSNLILGLKNILKLIDFS